VETALLLAGTPELVHTDQYTTNYIARVGDPGLLKPEFASATFSWLTRDIAPSGVMGDPSPATADNGWRWCEAMSDRIAKALIEMHDFREILER
jgi:creatinine amidohydrolase